MKSKSNFSIDCDFPGGNILVESVHGATICLRQDLRDTEGEWFYWGYRVRRAEGCDLTFCFTGSPVMGVRGPAFSCDHGATWTWLGRDHVSDNEFIFHFAEDANDVRFCFGMPYQADHLSRFLSSYLDRPDLHADTLCQTIHGRDVECLHVGQCENEPAVRVLLTCRHHCCEMMASYVLEGLLDAVLSLGTKEMKWLRERVEFMVIPFVDKDGVEEGDQGKNRRPHDHNRDYGLDGIYASTKALRERVLKWSAGKLKLALDLHCPHIKGEHNEVIYFVGSAMNTIWREQCFFSQILEKMPSSALPFSAVNNLPYGQGWNKSGHYKAGQSFAAWAAEISGVCLSSTLEIPYANAGGREVNQETARAFGGDLAQAISVYLIHRL